MYFFLSLSVPFCNFFCFFNYSIGGIPHFGALKNEKPKSYHWKLNTPCWPPENGLFASSLNDKHCVEKRNRFAQNTQVTVTKRMHTRSISWGWKFQNLARQRIRHRRIRVTHKSQMNKKKVNRNINKNDGNDGCTSSHQTHIFKYCTVNENARHTYSNKKNIPFVFARIQMKSVTLAIHSTAYCSRIFAPVFDAIVYHWFPPINWKGNKNV